MTADEGYELTENLFSDVFKIGFVGFVILMAFFATVLYFGAIPQLARDARITVCVTLALVVLVSIVYFLPLVLTRKMRIIVSDRAIRIYKGSIFGRQLLKIIPREQVSTAEIVITPWPKVIMPDLAFDAYGRFEPAGVPAVWIKTKRRYDRDLLLGTDHPQRVVSALALTKQ